MYKTDINKQHSNTDRKSVKAIFLYFYEALDMRENEHQQEKIVGMRERHVESCPSSPLSADARAPAGSSMSLRSCYTP